MCCNTTSYSRHGLREKTAGAGMSENTYDGSFCQRKPDISYPCVWEYKVIGEDQEKLKEAIRTACAPLQPEITLSNISSSGKYYSLNATLEVADETTRLSIFDSLQKSPGVKMVI